MMVLGKTIRAVVVEALLCLALGHTVAGQQDKPAARLGGPWEHPAAQMAEQVAKILGAGQAQLSVTNRSTIAAADVPGIRKLLVQDLRGQGIAVSGAESANQIRVTLSESARERLWVAEVLEGTQTKVVMIHVEREAAASPVTDAAIVLEKKRVWQTSGTGLEGGQGPVLAALETQAGLVVLERDNLAIYTMTGAEWSEKKRFPLSRTRSASRDARGMLIANSDGLGFSAYAPGTMCRGSYAPVGSGQYGEWTVNCRESDDPWPVGSGGSAGQRAFYNTGRNYFTGVMTPGTGTDIPAFYSFAVLPIGGNEAYLLATLDGKVMLAENGALKPVNGARDWGSDLAPIRSGCGAGVQVIASSSGEALKDSLRAYDVSRQEATPVSAPIEAGGSVTAMWGATDGASAWVVVRKGEFDYEVDRVAAICP